ncbi:XPA-binding protein 1, partial [Caligus rogercresseyi]
KLRLDESRGEGDAVPLLHSMRMETEEAAAIVRSDDDVYLKSHGIEDDDEDEGQEERDCEDEEERKEYESFKEYIDKHHQMTQDKIQKSKEATS